MSELAIVVIVVSIPFGEMNAFLMRSAWSVGIVLEATRGAMSAVEDRCSMCQSVRMTGDVGAAFARSRPQHQRSNDEDVRGVGAVVTQVRLFVLWPACLP